VTVLALRSFSLEYNLTAPQGSMKLETVAIIVVTLLPFGLNLCLKGAARLLHLSRSM
jgi:hypothetical protein